MIPLFWDHHPHLHHQTRVLEGSSDQTHLVHEMHPSDLLMVFTLSLNMPMNIAIQGKTRLAQSKKALFSVRTHSFGLILPFI